jgi:outer membrane protein TolC
MIRPSIPATGLLLLALLAPGCRSAKGWREQADGDVYRLVLERRSRLGIGDGSFTIEPKQDSLRQRLLRGETSELTPLTLVQCLEFAAENSRDYQSQKETLYLAALDLTLERWNFGVKKGGVLSASVAGTGDTAETASGGASFSLFRLLGTGAVIVGDIGLNLTRSLTSKDSWNPVSDLGLSITQPLLRGSGKRIVEEPLTQAERNLVYQVRSFERFRRTFAFDVANRFYSLLELQDVVKNQETNFSNLQKLSQRNAALAEAGRLSDIQAGQARQDELRSRDNLLQTRARLGRQKDDFKLFLGLPIQVDLAFEASELANLAGQDLSAIDLDEEQAAAVALASRLDHQNALDRREDSDRHAAVAEDALRAGLSLTANWDNPSQTGKPARFDFQDSTWSISAALDLPLDRLRERNAYRESLIAREFARRTAEQSADAIRSALRDDLRQTRSRQESWKIQQNAVALAAGRIESTDLKLQAGRADTRDLLEARQSLLDAQNAATTALVDYTLSRLALFRDMELLRVDEKGIRVDDQALPMKGPGRAASATTEGPSSSPAEAGA